MRIFHFGLMALTFLVMGFKPLSIGSNSGTGEGANSFVVGNSKETFLKLYQKGIGKGYFYYDELCSRLLSQLEGTPYGSCSVSCPANKTMVNFQSFDCVTLVESWWAMTRTIYMMQSGKAGEEKDPFELFVKNINRIRYFGGENCGIAFRIHYFTQQMLELERAGLVFNVAIANGSPFTKKIDYVSKNKDDFGPYAGSEFVLSLEKVLNTTTNYFYPLEKIELYTPIAKTGDIIAFATKEAGLDVSHTGIVTLEDGRVRITHASSVQKKVVHSQSLEEYLKTRTTLSGIFVYRPVF